MEYPSAPCNTVFTGGLLREPNNNLVCREDLIRVVVVCSFVHPCSPQFLKIVTLCDWVNGCGSCGVGTRLRECILVLYRSSKVDIYKILILKKITHGGTRNHSLPLRRRALYPIELRGLCLSDRNRTSDQQIPLINFYSLSLYQLSYAEF